MPREEKQPLRYKLYERVNVSVKTLNIVIIGATALLVALIVFGTLMK